MSMCVKAMVPASYKSQGLPQTDILIFVLSNASNTCANGLAPGPDTTHARARTHTLRADALTPGPEIRRARAHTHTHLRNRKTLAYASSCSLDATTDRPTAGFIQMCPQHHKPDVKMSNARERERENVLDRERECVCVCVCV
jgi:hypothetical protein